MSLVNLLILNKFSVSHCGLACRLSPFPPFTMLTGIAVLDHTVLPLWRCEGKLLISTFSVKQCKRFQTFSLWNDLKGALCCHSNESYPMVLSYGAVTCVYEICCYMKSGFDFFSSIVDIWQLLRTQRLSASHRHTIDTSSSCALFGFNWGGL